MLGAQSVAKAFPEYPTTIVKVYPPALHLKDYISMAGPEIMTVGRSEGAQKTFLVITCLTLGIGSRPSDHYFRSSVGLSVCLFVCAEFFSAVFDLISVKLGHMLYVWV